MYIIQRSSPCHLLSKESFDLIQGDTTNTGDLRKALKDAEAVIHLAVLTSIKELIEDPLAFNDANVTGTLCLLKESAEIDIKRSAYASSAAIYGKANQAPYIEERPVSPESPYGASKATVEAYCKAYRASSGMDTVVVRYMNVYGPRAWMDDYSGVMVKFANRLLRGQAPEIRGFFLGETRPRMKHQHH